MPPELIAWDFDGVLNRNVVEGRFVWADNMYRDLGLDRESFQSFVFGSRRGRHVMTGTLDVHDVVSEWLVSQGSDLAATEFVQYWFESDQYPDAEVLSWIKSTSARSVMATNNERHRTKFIAQTMGFQDHMHHIFASGHLGVAKPDSAYFAAIEDWSGHSGADILLVDDLRENVEAARAKGWQAFHFTDETRGELPALLGFSG